jgi:hypothetical protein
LQNLHFHHVNPVVIARPADDRPESLAWAAASADRPANESDVVELVAAGDVMLQA